MDFGMGPERRGGPPPMDEKGRHGEMIKNIVIDDMGRELSLTNEQKKQLKKIFDDNEPEQLAFHKEMKKRMDGFREKMDAQILQILDDKQKEKFKKFTGRFDENFEH